MPETRTGSDSEGKTVGNIMSLVRRGSSEPNNVLEETVKELEGTASDDAKDPALDDEARDSKKDLPRNVEELEGVAKDDAKEAAPGKEVGGMEKPKKDLFQIVEELVGVAEDDATDLALIDELVDMEKQKRDPNSLRIRAPEEESWNLGVAEMAFLCRVRETLL